MAVLRFAALTCLVLIQGACATQRDPASAGAAAASASGWLEFSVTDVGVPADPIAQLAGRPTRAPTCTLEVELDGAIVVSKLLRPTGSSPPYSVRSTFQFPVTAGEHEAGVTYSGCRAVGHRQDSVRASIRIPVHSRQITRIRFDGARLDAEFPVPTPPEAARP